MGTTRMRQDAGTSQNDREINGKVDIHKQITKLKHTLEILVAMSLICVLEMSSSEEQVQDRRYHGP